MRTAFLVLLAAFTIASAGELNLLNPLAPDTREKTNVSAIWPGGFFEKVTARYLADHVQRPFGSSEAYGGVVSFRWNAATNNVFPIYYALYFAPTNLCLPTDPTNRPPVPNTRLVTNSNETLMLAAQLPDTNAVYWLCVTAVNALGSTLMPFESGPSNYVLYKPGWSQSVDLTFP